MSNPTDESEDVLDRIVARANEYAAEKCVCGRPRGEHHKFVLAATDMYAAAEKGAGNG